MGQLLSQQEIVEIKRHEGEWSSSKGLRYDIVPWKLYEKAKKHFWDPADIDFSQDAKDWQNLSEEQRLAAAVLARGFMVGEESVTLDIVPLIIGVADEGRTEEAMYLTTFALDEAKHVEFFRLWFDAIGEDPQRIYELADERRKAVGAPFDPTEGMFNSLLPKVMRRVLFDRSPEAFLDCGLTYNQFVEGCLAISGYKLWDDFFAETGGFPGLRKGLLLVRRDEGRHITYGTYLCRRIIAANPELMDFARNRLVELGNYYFRYFFGFPVDREVVRSFFDEEGNLDESKLPPAEMLGLERRLVAFLATFMYRAWDQVDRRIQLLEKATKLSEEEAFLGEGAEAAEKELDTIVA
jgi:ribonucleoside-diphosphate reductase beta chain